MSVLSREKQLAVLAALVEGNSERAVERMTDVARATIARLALLFGAGAQRLHDRIVRDLACSLVEVDEIWSYVQKKEARVTERDAAGVGEAYTFVALDRTSRLAISFYVGKRDQESTDVFIQDLRARLVVMPSLMTSDGLVTYISAIGESFGAGSTYAQTVKNYTKGAARGPDHRYEPARDPFITKRSVYGAPDMGNATTAHIERQNGTMRHHIGRMRRLCLAFSKKIANHKAAIALNYAWYNLGTIVKTIRMTPAMSAGVTDHIWSLEEFMDAVLSEPAGELPTAKPLRHLAPEGTARELPGGRGFLRALPGGKGGAPSPMPDEPTPAPVASVEAPAMASPAPEEDPQLDLLAWRPKPPKRGQLSLFGESEE